MQTAVRVGCFDKNDAKKIKYVKHTPGGPYILYRSVIWDSGHDMMLMMMMMVGWSVAVCAWRPKTSPNFVMRTDEHLYVELVSISGKSTQVVNKVFRRTNYSA